MLDDAADLADAGPIAIRYPRGAARNVDESEVGAGLHARRARSGDAVCVLAVGRMLEHALKAADELAAEGIEATVWDARSCAPLDPDMIADAASHPAVVTVEDGIRAGGIGMAMVDEIREIHAEVPVAVLGIPTQFVAHGDPKQIMAKFGLDGSGIAATARALLAETPR
jgi:1-deoxy-D-xylulose-5-phosphate synthase